VSTRTLADFRGDIEAWFTAFVYPVSLFTSGLGKKGKGRRNALRDAPRGLAGVSDSAPDHLPRQMPRASYFRAININELGRDGIGEAKAAAAMSGMPSPRRPPSLPSISKVKAALDALDAARGKPYEEPAPPEAASLVDRMRAGVTDAPDSASFTEKFRVPRRPPGKL